MERELIKKEVVRTIQVSLADPITIFKSIELGKETSILSVNLAVKGTNGNRRLTFYGGNILPGENHKDAVMRELFEEAALNPFLAPSGMGKIQVGEGQSAVSSYEYVLKGVDEPTRVHLYYVPVLQTSSNLSGDEKVKGRVSVSLEEFKKVVGGGGIFIDGYGEMQLEEHLVLGHHKKDIIKFGEGQEEIQKTLLNKSLDWMSHIDDYLKKRLTEKRVYSNYEEFKAEYDRLLHHFMTRAVTVAYGEEAAIKELKYNSQRNNLVATYHPESEDLEPKVEKAHEERRKKELDSRLLLSLNDGHLGKDIFYFLPELSEKGIDWVNKEKLPNAPDIATEGLKAFAEYIEDVFNGFLENEKMSREEYERFLLGDSPLAKKNKIMSEFDSYFRERLKKTFPDITDFDLDFVYREAQDFDSHIFEEIKASDFRLSKGLKHGGNSIPEVLNANFGYSLSLFLGYDYKVNTPEAEKLIRFSAGKKLLLILKGLGGIKHYQNQIRLAERGRLQDAINTAFGSHIGSVEVRPSNDMQINTSRRVWKRRNENTGQDEEYIILVDEKKPKSFYSFLRKSFYLSPEKIRDFQSVNLVFTDTKFDINKLELVDELLKYIYDYTEHNFSKGSIREVERDKYGSKLFKEMCEKGDTGIDGRSVGGKRSGSEGKRLIRTAVNYVLNEGGDSEEKFEVVVYPYQTINEKERRGFWDYLSKLRDDPNYLIRRMLMDKSGLVPFYYMLFPPDIFGSHYLHSQNSEFWDPGSGKRKPRH